VDPRHLEHLGVGQRRQDPGQAAREHRLASARRPGEEKVVATGGGELERAAGAFVPPHLGELGKRVGRRAAVAVRAVGRRRRLATEV